VVFHGAFETIGNFNFPIEQDTFVENRSSFTAPNSDDRHKKKKFKKKTHTVKLIHSSLRSESIK